MDARYLPSTIRRQLDGKVEEQTSEWVWVLTVPEARLPTKAAVEMGHSRWAIENEGFNEAVNRWHLDHVYRHDPNAMRVLILLIMLATNVLGAFYRRALKPARRARESMLHVARCIMAALYAGRWSASAPG